MLYKDIYDKYNNKLNLIETEEAIKFCKDTFETLLSKELDLLRVSAPLFVLPETGLNDNLNGYERAVSFDVLDLKKNAEIVQSLAKWKRNALDKYNIPVDKGIYTDMNAIRRDEELDNIHSVYVDQWDWERHISKDERNLDYLKYIVNKIYSVLKKTEELVNNKYKVLSNKLPDEIKFITTYELEDLYKDLTPKERENEIIKKYNAVFLISIGDKLKNGKPHDGRASDYDDWSLNGDLLVYNKVLDKAFELSSMGIRVDKDSLIYQLKEKNELSKQYNPYCKMILNDELPLSIGGGIGQSRLCMFYLEKCHIGEVQSSLWSDEDIEYLKEKGINLL